MKRFITFGDIQQFRTIIKNVQSTARYQGQDENDEPIIDRNAIMPKVSVIASEKIHGTCGAVCFSNPDGFWVQSRKNIITPEKDNAGCAFFCENNKDIWITYIIKDLVTKYNINLNKYIISVYFEWAGGSIQGAKSACSGLDKRAVIFQHFKVSPIEPSEIETSKWYETRDDLIGWAAFTSRFIFNIMNFKVWEFEIDFEQPLLSQNKMIAIVSEEIEPNSPVGKAMGKDGNVGEGIVVTFMYKNTLQRFKVKREAHSKSKVKTLKPVNEEEEKIKIGFANYACSASRLEQAWQTVFGIDNETQEPDVKCTGDFIRAVIQDIIKEESDIMAEKGLEPKIIGKFVSKISRTWFMEQLDELAGL